MTKTLVTRATDIKRSWHSIDLKGKVLGRVAVEIAKKLVGKDKPYFTPHLDCGDYVVVTNAREVEVTGRKSRQKIYFSHSGYPGGVKEFTWGQMMRKDPSRLVRLAVAGMLPKNKLRDPRLARLKIFVDREQPYAEKFKTPVL